MTLRKDLQFIAFTLFVAALAACSGADSSRPDLIAPQHSVGGQELSVTPSTLSFASPTAATQSVIASTNFAGAVTASVDAGGSCSVSPASQNVQPGKGGMKTARFDVSPVSAGACRIHLTDKKGNSVLVTADVLNPNTCTYFMQLAGEGPTISSTGTSARITAAGGQYALAIIPSSDDCTWTAMSNVSWIHIDEPVGEQAGSNTVFYTVDVLSHTASERTGKIILTVPSGSSGTLSVTINQVHSL